MAVLSVGRDDRVASVQGTHRADGDRFLADVEMEKAADLLLLVELAGFLLQAADSDHLPEEIEQMLAAEMRFDRASVAHVAPLSSVDRSPSGRPSSRARSKRRMIFPLRVRGISSRGSISLGATTGPNRLRA